MPPSVGPVPAAAPPLRSLICRTVMCKKRQEGLVRVQVGRGGPERAARAASATNMRLSRGGQLTCSRRLIQAAQRSSCRCSGSWTLLASATLSRPAVLRAESETSGTRTTFRCIAPAPSAHLGRPEDGHPANVAQRAAAAALAAARFAVGPRLSARFAFCVRFSQRPQGHGSVLRLESHVLPRVAELGVQLVALPSIAKDG